jgi:hypothetical protein
MTMDVPKPQKRKTLSRLWHVVRLRHILLATAVLVGAVCGLLVLLAVHVLGDNPKSSQPQRHAIIQVAGLTVQHTRSLPARELMSGQLLEGKKGILVDLTVVNETNTTQPFIPVHQMILRDDLGRTYTLAPLGEVKQPISAGNLKVGEKRSGELSFMVDDTAQSLHLIFDSRWNDGPPVSISL